jgi:hypothetical protein
VQRSSIGAAERAVVHLHHSQRLHTESEHPMSFDMGGLILARQAARQHVTSAQPDAPIRPDRPLRRSRNEALRRYSALLLRRLARRGEPGEDDLDPARQRSHTTSAKDIYPA